MESSSESQANFIASLAKNYNVLPLYEKSIADYQHMRQVSLQKNKYLACKWQEYKNIVAKKRIPFDFPYVSDFHFYNYQHCYKPSESINQHTDFRYSLVPGPGVDEHGVIPIPTDLVLRSNITKTNRKSAVLKKRDMKKRMKII